MDLLIFALGAMIGVLAGGALVVRRFRAAIAGDIGPPIRRMHAEIDPQLRGMQNQLDNIESAVNLALASRYPELSKLPWPPAIRRPGRARKTGPRERRRALPDLYSGRSASIPVAGITELTD